MTDVCDIEFLTIEEAAELLRVKSGTLDNWRSEEDGPPYRRHGSRILYERTELLKWSERRRARTPQVDESNKSTTPHDGNAGGRHPGDRVSSNERPTGRLERKP